MAIFNEQAEKLKNQGNQYFKEQRFHKAIDFYTKALEQEAHPIILSNRAQAYLKVHKPQEAYVDADEALRRDANNVKSLFRRAQALIKLGLKVKARTDLERCVKLEPTNKEAKNTLDTLKNARDNTPVDVYCFHRDEAIQSDAPLKSIKIVTSQCVEPRQINSIDNFSPEAKEESAVSEEETKTGENDACTSTAARISMLSVNELSEKGEGETTDESEYPWAELPAVAHNLMEFLAAWVELRDEPVRFAAYILKLDVNEFGSMFDELADLDILPTLIHGLYLHQEWSLQSMRRALTALSCFSMTTRFSLCVALLDDSSRIELTAFLARIQNFIVTEGIDKIRIAYQLDLD